MSAKINDHGNLVVNDHEKRCHVPGQDKPCGRWCALFNEYERTGWGSYTHTVQLCCAASRLVYDLGSRY